MSLIKTDEFTGITYRAWAASKPKAVMLLVHGLGAHSGRWEFLAQFLLKYNISSYAIELRGFGETKDLKGHISSFGVYYKDINSLRDIIQRENPGKKIVLIGESMGALICFLAALRFDKNYDGLVCISPAFKDKLKFGILGYLAISLANIFYPKKQFKVPFGSNMCTRDVEYQQIADSDQREHRFASARLLLNLGLAQLQCRAMAGKMKTPNLFLISGDDLLVDKAFSKTIFEKLGVMDKKYIEYPGMYHSLSVDLGKENVFNDLLMWLKERISL